MGFESKPSIDHHNLPVRSGEEPVTEERKVRWKLDLSTGSKRVYEFGVRKELSQGLEPVATRPLLAELWDTFIRA